MRLTTDALAKRYGDFELSIPDLDIEPGTALGLVGNNGAGKTTFLRLVLDLIRADDGQVRLNGDPVADTFDWRTRTGSYLGPSFLIDFLTPDEYWHFVGQTYEMDEDTVDERLALAWTRAPLARKLDEHRREMVEAFRETEAI